MTSEPLRIGELAGAAGVSVDTIRHYERKGVLQNVVRDAGGYRRFPPDALGRVRVVRRALAIGFTLDELARIFRQRAAGSPPCRGVRDLAARKLAELDEKIASLTALRATLAGTLASWDDRLRATGAGEFAHLLEMEEL
jgi:DNA-binding transcriptional MerR regulator